MSSRRYRNAAVALILLGSAWSAGGAPASAVQEEKPNVALAEDLAFARSLDCEFVSVLSIKDPVTGDIQSLAADGSMVDGSRIEGSNCSSSAIAENRGDPNVTLRSAVAVPDAGTTAATTVKLYTPTSPSYTKTDANAVFTGQATVTSPNYYVAFSFTLSTAVRSIVNGNVQALVTRTPAAGTCSYSKYAAPNYFFHWSCQTPYRAEQTMTGAWAFNTIVGGEAAVTWYHNYKVSK